MIDDRVGRFLYRRGSVRKYGSDSGASGWCAQKPAIGQSAPDVRYRALRMTTCFGGLIRA
jgi:hypothetical protein